MGEQKIRVHIMHSMKGGCGKSACALFKAMQLAKQDKVDNSKVRVLFVDADFKGSALQTLLFENMETEDFLYRTLLKQYTGYIVKGDGLAHHLAVPDNYSEDKNLNKFLREKDISLIEILNKSFSYTKGGSGEEDSADGYLLINGFLDFVLSSSKSEDKALFKRGSGNALEIGIFKYRISAFLKQIFEYGKVDGQDRGQYSDLVIDMPPGYDEYSDLIMEELRRLAQEKGMKNTIELHYYSVTTNDVGHIRLTSDNIKRTMKDTSYQSWKSVNVILSCMREDDFIINSGKIQSITNDIINLCHACMGKGKVYRCSYQDSYYKFCRSHIISEFSCPAEFDEIIEVEGELTTVR